MQEEIEFIEFQDFLREKKMNIFLNYKSLTLLNLLWFAFFQHKRGFPSKIPSVARIRFVHLHLFISLWMFVIKFFRMNRLIT